MPNKTGLNIIFAGTPEFAKHHLAALINSRHRVICVYTQPDRPAGRGKKLQASPVKQLALEANIEVQQPINLKDEQAQSLLADFNADIMIVVAYGLLLPKAVLDAPKLGCINVHGSILPRWRGAAPIQRAIEAGDKESGITIMQMDIGLDTGDMLTKTFCPIQNDDTASALHDRLAEIGPDALLEALEHIDSGTTAPITQNNELATYAHKLSKKEAELDWALSATVIERRIRAFNPFPVATALLNGARLRIHSATENLDVTEKTSVGQIPGTIISHNGGIVVACGENTSICIKKLQLPGKKAINSEDILNGAADKFQIGTVFDSKTGDA